MTPEEARKQELKDVKDLMASKAGHRFIWRVLARAGIFRSNPIEDHAAMSCREGQRQLGLMIFADIMEACPETYLKMIKTNREVIIDGFTATDTSAFAE